MRRRGRGKVDTRRGPGSDDGQDLDDAHTDASAINANQPATGTSDSESDTSPSRKKQKLQMEPPNTDDDEVLEKTIDFHPPPPPHSSFPFHVESICF